MVYTTALPLSVWPLSLVEKIIKIKRVAKKLAICGKFTAVINGNDIKAHTYKKGNIFGCGTDPFRLPSAEPRLIRFPGDCEQLKKILNRLFSKFMVHHNGNNFQSFTSAGTKNSLDRRFILFSFVDIQPKREWSFLFRCSTGHSTVHMLTASWHLSFG